MNKNIYKIVMICGAVVMLSACGFNVPDKQAVEDMADTAKQKATEMAEEGEKMIGTSITDMLSSGKAMTCTWEDGTGMNGVMYVDGDRMRSEVMNVPQASGEMMGTMYTMSDGEWLYTWTSDSSEGTKFSVKEDVTEDVAIDDGAIDDMPETMDPDMADAMNIDENYTYDCDTWRVDEAMFSVPSNINFIDMDAMMDQMPGDIDLNNVCDMLTGQDKIDCEAETVQ